MSQLGFFDVANRYAGLDASKNRRTIAQEYFRDSNTYAYKCDYKLAHKLLIQSDILNPHAGYLSENFKTRTGTKQDAALVGRQDADNGTVKKFDFLFVHSGRSASTAIQTLLSLHPSVFVVPKQEIDDALAYGTESELLARYVGHNMVNRPEIMVGLMQHDFVSGLHVGREYAERVSRVVNRDFFVQSVREPVPLIRSSFNHSFISSIAGGGHKFRSLIPDSPFWAPPKDIYDLLAEAHAHPAHVEWDTGSAKRKGEAKFESVGKGVKLNTIGLNYARHFDEWRVIDFSAESKLRQGGGALRSLELIEAPGGYDDPMFALKKINSPDRSLMTNNFIEVTIRGCQLPLGIGYAHEFLRSHNFSIVDLWWFDPGDEWDATGLEKKQLSVTTFTENWEILTEDVRLELVEGDLLERFAHRVLLPAWAENFVAWRNALDPMLIRDGDASFENFVIEKNLDEIERFLQAHPKICSLWPDTVEALGRFGESGLATSLRNSRQIIRSPEHSIANDTGVFSFATFIFEPSLEPGKFYWEIILNNAGASDGALGNTACLGMALTGHADNEELGTQLGGWGWRCDGTLMSLDISKSFGRATVKNGDVAMIAVDMKEGNLWFGLNGEWFDEADPGSGIRPAFTSLAAKLNPSVSSLHGGLGSMVMTICFDASRWQYRPPPGFTSVPIHRG